NDNLELVVNIGADLRSSKNSVELAKKYDRIYATIGVHPHSVKDMDSETLAELREVAKEEKVVAIGEIGLDYYYDNSPRDTQKIWFREQIKLAKELDLPISVHSREATKDTFDIISEEAKDGKLR